MRTLCLCFSFLCFDDFFFSLLSRSLVPKPKTGMDVFLELVCALKPDLTLYLPGPGDEDECGEDWLLCGLVPNGTAGASPK